MAKGVLVRARRLISPGWSKHWAEVAGPRHGGPTGVSALQMAQWAVRVPGTLRNYYIINEPQALGAPWGAEKVGPQLARAFSLKS